MTIDNLLDQCMSEELTQMVISNPKKENEITKIKIRPVLLKEDLYYQVTSVAGSKVFHSNYNAVQIKEKIKQWVEEEYKQAQITTATESATILSGKNSNLTIKYKKNTNVSSENQKTQLGHNRSKNYILKDGVPVEFLIDLGVMNHEGKVITQKYDKFRQINRFLEFIEDVLPQLDKHKEQTIIDFGCGKSYLTFAMYYYLNILKKYSVRIIGLDLKEDVIRHCNQLSGKYGYDKLQFYVGDIADYEGVNQADMVVSLHACDTATDYALHKAITWGAKVILSVPCCQHEANRELKNKSMESVLKYGILKERMAAILTDAIRAELLESQGYKTQILEFIDMEHTPKNLLIRAVKYRQEDTDRSEEAILAVKRLQEECNLDLTLSRLISK